MCRLGVGSRGKEDGVWEVEERVEVADQRGDLALPWYRQREFFSEFRVAGLDLHQVKVGDFGCKDKRLGIKYYDRIMMMQ